MRWEGHPSTIEGHITQLPKFVSDLNILLEDHRLNRAAGGVPGSGGVLLCSLVSNMALKGTTEGRGEPSLAVNVPLNLHNNVVLGNTAVQLELDCCD